MTQGWLRPSRVILTKTSLLSSFSQIPKTTTISSLGCNFKRLQSQLSESQKPQPDIVSSETTTVKNDKFKLPQDTAFKGSYKEDYQRIIKYSLIPLTMIPFYTSYAGMTLNPMIDGTIATLFLFYAHYGFSSFLINKLPQKTYPRGQNFSLWGLCVATTLGLCGIYTLETENNGVVDLITRLWNDDESNIYVFGK